MWYINYKMEKRMAPNFRLMTVEHHATVPILINHNCECITLEWTKHLLIIVSVKVKVNRQIETAAECTWRIVHVFPDYRSSEKKDVNLAVSLTWFPVACVPLKCSRMLIVLISEPWFSYIHALETLAGTVEAVTLLLSLLKTSSGSAIHMKIS